MKNFLLQKIVRLLQKKTPPNPLRERILVVSTTALGDTLWATPAIESIRRQKPESYLAVLTSSIGKEVLNNNPYIDDLFLLKEPLFFSFFSLWKELYPKKFDTVFLLHASQRLTLPLCSLLGASRIIGTKGLHKGLDDLLTDALDSTQDHEIRRRLKILEKANIAASTEELSFFPSCKITPPSDKTLTITLHPGSKDSFKRWPKENFILLGKKIKDAFHCHLWISGVEHDLTEEIRAAIPGAKKLDPFLSLDDFASHLLNNDLLISNDTGPVHLACALRRKVIALYAPTDPLLCGPHKAKEAITLSRRASCTPCLKRKCKEPFCLFQISVDEVFEKVSTKLYRT